MHDGIAGCDTVRGALAVLHRDAQAMLKAPPLALPEARVHASCRRDEARLQYDDAMRHATAAHAVMQRLLDLAQEIHQVHERCHGGNDTADARALANNLQDRLRRRSGHVEEVVFAWRERALVLRDQLDDQELPVLWQTHGQRMADSPRQFSMPQR